MKMYSRMIEYRNGLPYETRYCELLTETIYVEGEQLEPNVVPEGIEGIDWIVIA